MIRAQNDSDGEDSMNGGGGDNQQPTGTRGGGMMKLNLGGASNGMTKNSRAVNQNVNMMMMQAKK